MFFSASVSSFIVFFSLVAFAPSVNQALLSLQQLRGDAGGGGLGSGLDGGRWLRDPGDSSCSFLSAAVQGRWEGEGNKSMVLAVLVCLSFPPIRF